MSTEIKSIKPMTRVKILAAPKESPHPLQCQVGTVQGIADVRKNRAGTVIFKSYNVSFGHSSVREIEGRYLWPME